MLSGESDLMYIFCIVNFLLSTTVCLYVSGTVYHICGCQNKMHIVHYMHCEYGNDVGKFSAVLQSNCTAFGLCRL